MPCEHRCSWISGADGLHVHIRDGSSKAKTARKRKEPRNQGTLFNFSGEGGRLHSGRTHHGFVTIDTEQVTSHSASVVRPAPRENRSVPVSKPRSHGLKPIVPKERTLQEYWEDGPDEVEPPPRLHREGDGNLVLRSRRVTPDFDVLLLPAGMSFGGDSCLGRGWLHELVALITAERDEHCPVPHSFLTFDLHPSMSAQEFELVLEKGCQHMRDIFSQRDFPSPEENGAWQSFLHSVAQHLSWLLARAAAEEYVSLCASLQKHLAQLQDIVDQPREVLPEDDRPSVLELEIRWFTLEATARLECHRTRRHGVVEGSAVSQHTQRLLMRLWSIGFQELLTPFKNDIVDPVVNDPFAKRAAELWVSLMHFVEAWASAKDPKLDESDRLVSLWHVLHRLVSQDGLLRTSASEVASCESLWRCVFTLCALSQFSLHGTSLSSPRAPASWQCVELALDRVKLTADPALQAPLSKRSLQKRDEYIRIQLARCLILARKWKWSLGDAINLVNRLLEIFKSRNFANMTDEYPEFPSFLRHNNIHLLNENKRSDTAFTLFLKLVVKAVNDTRPPAQVNNGAPAISPKVKKLLSLIAPVTAVAFTKAKPPTAQQLSMLYNRFSAVAVTIYLEPSLAGVKYSLGKARRYVKFEDADDETRRACIRGLMHLAILLRHLHMPLQDIWDWLAHMSNVLVDEYTQTHGARIATGIQMLLGCVRRVIETPLMDPGQTVAAYPDPAWLNGREPALVYSHGIATDPFCSMGQTGLLPRHSAQRQYNDRQRDSEARAVVPELQGGSPPAATPTDAARGGKRGRQPGESRVLRDGRHELR